MTRDKLVKAIDKILRSKDQKTVSQKLKKLRDSIETSEEDIMSSIIRSHKAICKYKKMDEKAAYGMDPAIYYTLGVAGEAGEMANNIVKSLRNGYNEKDLVRGVKDELPDVIIYSYVLAYVLDIDLTKLVNEKVEIVIKRAESGYYGKKNGSKSIKKFQIKKKS